MTSALQADGAWASLRDLRLDSDLAVTELVVYEEVAANWHDAGRLRFGGDPA